MIKMKTTARKIPDEINNPIPDLATVFQAINSENLPAVTIDVWNIAKMSATTGFHIAVGPAPDTSLPSFTGDCPLVHSYYPTSMSPVDMLCDDVETQSIELVYIFG